MANHRTSSSGIICMGLSKECKLFNMETTVEKLEAMFQKSEADLECIEKRLKLDFTNTSAERGVPTEENMVALLESLGTIKAKHAALCSQVKQIAAAQQESMDSIRTHLSGTLQVLQHFQMATDVELSPLSETEKQALAMLGSTVPQNTVEIPL